MSRDRLFTVLAALWALLVLVACLLRMDFLGERGMSTQGIPHLDKVAHFGAFAVMAVLTMFAGPSKGRAVPIFLVGTAYGILIEVLQGSLTATRDADALDAVADSVGVAAGIAFAYCWRRSRLERADAAIQARVG